METFVEGLEFDQIGELERGWLERRFEKVEILSVVRDLEGDKAPGPDGFSMVFFHHCWRVVERDVLVVFEEFYQHCEFEKSLNATFIVLIPKKNDVSNIRDFRPISLVGSFYKIELLEQPLLLLPHESPHPLLRNLDGYPFYENWPSCGRT